MPSITLREITAAYGKRNKRRPVRATQQPKPPEPKPAPTAEEIMRDPSLIWALP